MVGGKGGCGGVYTYSSSKIERVVLLFDTVMVFKERRAGSAAAGAAPTPKIRKLWKRSKR